MFTPGEHIVEFTSKKGNRVTLRTTMFEDVILMTEYMNILSNEDTFLTLSGEQISIEEEKTYLAGVLNRMQAGDELKIVAFVDAEMVATAEVTGMTRKSRHYGTVSISVKKEFRGEGIGKQIMEVLLEGAKKMNLHSIQLTLFDTNIAGRRLYEQLGFQEVGRIPKKLSHKNNLVDEIVMVKHL